MSHLHLQAVCGPSTFIAAMVCLVGYSPVSAQTTVAAERAAKQVIKLDEIATLKTAKQLLEGANHDYKGHRAKAMEAIHKAIVEIEHHGHKAANRRLSTTSGAATAKTNAKAQHAQIAAKTPKVHEGQAFSDAQLRAAEQLLVKVQAELATGRHPKAIAHVQQALQELQVALAIN